MKRVLITGSTGNVGIEVIASLRSLAVPIDIIAGVRDVAADAAKLSFYDAQLRRFDFTDASTFETALSECDYLFLLRPPAISNVARYFKPLIAAAKNAGIRHIVFLSVQGVQHSRIIPHHKIEGLILASGIPYTFLRPAYFMQNFTTTLHRDLAERQRIFLPSGAAKFTLVDVRDIGLVAAHVLANPQAHCNKSYELTSDEALGFSEMAARLSNILRREIKYESPNLLRFYQVKRDQGMPPAMILVMIMLHYLPRFSTEAATTGCIRTITGRDPKSFETFILDYRNALV